MAKPFQRHHFLYQPTFGRYTMTTTFFQLVLCAALALPAYAGQGTIRETETQIIIEYSGGEEGEKAAKTREEELESQRQVEQAENKKREEENSVQQQRLERAKVKGARKAEQYKNINSSE
jgi:hypothetical protein